jgi:hypothetical protein
MVPAAQAEIVPYDSARHDEKSGVILVGACRRRSQTLDARLQD